MHEHHTIKMTTSSSNVLNALRILSFDPIKNFSFIFSRRSSFFAASPNEYSESFLS